MNYEFKFYIDHSDLFNYSMNHMKCSKTFIFDCIFTGVAFIALIFTLVTGRFNAMSDIKKILLIVCCLMFPVIQPVILYIKTSSQAKKLEGHLISIIFNDNEIIASTDNENSVTKYGDVYNFIKYKNMIVLMYTMQLGQIIPDRVLTNKDKFFEDVSNKIKEARKNNDIESNQNTSK